MKIMNDVTKVNSHQHDRHGLPSDTLGAIIYYGEDKLFVDLDNENDVDKFNKFVAESADNDKWAWEDTLYTKFCVEDVDTEWYRYYVDGECINGTL